MAKKLLVYHLAEPHPGSSEAKIEIHAVDGNLQIDALAGGTELASGTLQYLENQNPPTRSVHTTRGKTTLTLKSEGKGQPWFRLPWAACNGATEWQIHLTPTSALDIMAHSGGGNITLDLTGLTVTSLSADTGGGNMDVFLPDRAAGLHVDIKSGAGNVTVHLPAGIAARIQAATGLGKVILDGPYRQTGQATYQSDHFENAGDIVEISAHSGAGNVIIKEMAPAAIRS